VTGYFDKTGKIETITKKEKLAEKKIKATKIIPGVGRWLSLIRNKLNAESFSSCRMVAHY
jgi:hypothetical protein